MGILLKQSKSSKGQFLALNVESKLNEDACGTQEQNLNTG
jgi:hypothetical protein